MLSSSVFADERNLPGIDLVTRAERWADESLRYTSLSREQRQEIHEEDMEELKETDFDAYTNKQEEAEKNAIANKYLRDNFPDEQIIDFSYSEENGKYLITPISVKREKIKLIVHHTAEMFSGLNTDAKVQEAIRKIYEFHARKRGRGDIGYNFIIAPDGKIYEGRVGWPGTVWMHTLWNNTPSIGISVMGNFEKEQPTQEQIDSLIKLLSVLAKQYGIDPTDRAKYHKASKTYPYVTDVENYTIIGHTDAGSTACPGENLYAQLPFIREKVRKNLVMYALTSWQSGDALQPVQTTFSVPWLIYADGETKSVSVNATFADIVSCSFENTVRAGDISCTSSNGKITLKVTKKSGIWSGRRVVVIKDSRGNELHISFVIVWQSDMARLLETAKAVYIKLHGSLGEKQPMQKILHHITLEEAKDLMQEDKKVLLYEASTTLSQREIKCDRFCMFWVDDTQMSAISWIIIPDGDNVVLAIGTGSISWKTVRVRDGDGGKPVHITNYGRKSYAGIPRNTFRGELVITKQTYQNIDSQQREDKVVVINQLSFSDYMKGIVETNDTEHIEKNKVMALIAKSYALFYMTPEHKHPSVPDGALYNAVDDARIYQKYVGAGLEKTLKKRYQALEETKNQIVLYDAYVPILPYFSCSAGFTRSGKEKRGWTDTPYLQSVFDVYKCSDFNGHGVGLSGKWAQRWASMGKTYDQIIQYYYPGVEIEKM